MTSKVKGEGRKVTWHIWQVFANKLRTKHPRNTKIGGKVTHPTGNNVYMFQGQGHMVNNTSFQTTIAFYFHSLGGNTSTIYNFPTTIHCHSLLARWRYWQHEFALYEYILVACGD